MKFRFQLRAQHSAQSAAALGSAADFVEVPEIASGP